MARKNTSAYFTENDVFPTKLRELMKETGTSQETLANFIGVTRQSVGYYAQGQSSPDWKGLVKIAEFFKVSLDYLLTDSEIKSSDVGMQAACRYTHLSEDAVNNIKCTKILSDAAALRLENAEPDSDEYNLLVHSNEAEAFRLLDKYMSSSYIKHLGVALAHLDARLSEAKSAFVGAVDKTEDAEQQKIETVWRLSKYEEYMKEIRIAELDLSDCIANFTEHELEVRNTKAKLEIMIDTLRDTLSEY